MSETTPSDKGWLNREIFAAVLLALTTIATAWCAYQSARWSGQQASYFTRAGAARIAATQQSTRAGQYSLADVLIFTHYMKAIIEDEPKVAQAMYRRFRPEAKVAVDAWLALHPLDNPLAPPGPFIMKEYHPKMLDDAEAMNRQAEEMMNKGLDANQQSDNYVLLTVLFASVMFFGGLATKFRSRGLQTVLILFGYLVYLAGVGILMTYPVY
ncbi:MAG: hypothetical protein K8R69_01895 [Deltaproteobacteria bacterium]|nr:hypothetical protein [Deltaproteobacteria bacterium]